MHFSHHTFVSETVKELRVFSSFHPAAAVRILELQTEVLAIASLDLEPARPMLLSYYAPTHSGSQTPRDPVAMFRCLLLMAFLGFVSFNQWAKYLKGHPELSILSGFPPQKPPGNATFYDFMARILDGPYQKECQHSSRPSRRFRGVRNRFRRQLHDEKSLRSEEFENADEGKVKQAVARSLSRFEEALPEDFTKRINELLMVCAVVPSAKRGMLGNLGELAVAGDGSALPSQACGKGHALCECRKQGIAKCGCDRMYSDPQATWGWDSYRRRYYFGYRLHAMCGSFSGRDLPLHVMIDGAHRHDSLMGVEASDRLYKQFRQHLPQAKFKYGIFDAGYDASELYRMWMRFGATPIIALNRSHGSGVNADGWERTPEGVPLCPGGVEFKRHGLNRAQGKMVYHCRAKYMGRTNGKIVFKVDLARCPLGALCEPKSKMGPLANLYLEENPRWNGPVARGSDEFEELMNRRGCTERFFSKLESKGLKEGCYRRKHIFLVRVMAEGIVSHAQAWVKERFGKKKASTVDELLCWVEELLT